MKRNIHTVARLAIALAVASACLSCSGRLAQADTIDLDTTPVQTVEDMFAVQTRRGRISMRMEAPLMEKYDRDTVTCEEFPEGINVFGYTEETGLLETVIAADNARHITPGHGSNNEVWQAFGNVVIHNVIKQETMETDTIYWDRTSEEIYTDCYVKMYSKDGFMQGYGMRSDDHARNAVLNNPFNSYGVSVRDSSAVLIDSVNFIGPFPKK